MDAIRKELQLDATSGELLQPHYEPLEFDGNVANYPLILVPYITIGPGEGEDANLPLMEEFINPFYSTIWENVVELHPTVARSIGAEDNEEVQVESPHGRIRCRLRISETVRPDVACIALGLGHEGYGRYADGIGTNPKRLLAKYFDRISGEAVLINTRVRVVKA